MNRLLLASALLPCALLAQEQQTRLAQTEFFESRIRPVMAQQCYGCHTNSKLAGLRLDSREDVLKGGKSGPAIVPGEPEKSLLIAAINHSGPVQMPKSASKLSDAQIEDFTKWVKDGAFWPAPQGSGMKVNETQRGFWSFVPLAKPAAPEVKDKAWPVNEIDKFVLARLEKDGLKPGATVDRRTLLRRVTFDLTGLPPTYEEVKAFEADKSPTAYEKVIDRLLASPQYGERWARHWMDVVRYGEDDYNVGKKPDRAEKYPFAYLYRDWLIGAFNEDMPYDTFVKAQLAADMMDDQVRPKMIPALGMHGTGVWAFLANLAPLERADEWSDKVDVTTKAFLGLTVGCARCHDHMYDPIPTKDFYGLAGVFASTQFHAYPRVPESVVKEYDQKKEKLEEMEKGQKEFLDKASDLYAQALLLRTEDYMLAAWRVGKEKRATVQSIAQEYKLDAEVLDRWVKFLKKKPVHYSFVTPWQEMVAKGGTEDEAKTLAFNFYTKLSEVNKEYLKLRSENEVALAQLKAKEPEQFDPMPNGNKRRLTKYQIALKVLGTEETYLWEDVFLKDLPEFEEIADLDLDKKPSGLLRLEGWSLEQRLSSDLAVHAARLKENIEKFKKGMPEQYPFVYGLEELKEPTNLKVYVRGDPFNLGEDAPRAFLSALSEGEPKLFEKGSGRMELAEAIVKEPITARVVVNRVWRWHMGSGIVETTNNFGLVGERPSNPELLEHLADKFVADGMSWKKLHKEILLSRTYQLSTAPIEANMTKDPANRLYWRANGRRLSAEGVWDALLTASGKLDKSVLGGPSAQLDEKMSRRGVYAKISRMYPDNFLTTFDVPAATISASERYTTNVPQQRLFFLNSPVVHQQAQSMADRVRAAGDEAAQVKKAYEIALQRAPSAEELAMAIELLKSPIVEPSSSVGAMPAGVAAKPAGERAMSETVTEESKPEAKVMKDDPLKSLCWALLSSNEFLFLN